MSGKRSGELPRRIVLAVALIALVAIEIIFRMENEPSWYGEQGYQIATRLIGGAVCVVFMVEFSFTKVFRISGNGRLSGLIAILPAMAIAVNNFPFVSFFSGDCGLSASAKDILIYALFCLLVGFFEEMAFRGCVFTYLLKKRKGSRLGIFMSIFWSSVVFGTIHLVNLFTSSPGAVLLQLGYSALIGALCAFVLLETGNIWLCVLLHSTYNFVGNVIPELGQGTMWTTEQMIFTAVISVIVTVYTVWRFLRMPIERAEELYK